ncbi:hypothetical protein FQZ97_1072530 [compost metagenome]
MFFFFDQPVLQELQVFRAMLQGITDNVFDKALRQVHVIFEVKESYFRLYHPEFGQVTGGIGVLGPESRSEGIDP